MKPINLLNKRFGRLLVLKRLENNKHGRTIWLCKCDCGNSIKVSGNSLLRKNTQSCGCLRNQKSKERMLNKNIVQKGIKNPAYNGGLTFHKTKNRWFIVCRNKQQVAFSRAVYEAKIGIELPDKSVVHHIDLDSSNDKEENLYLFSNHAAHTRYHNIVGEGVSSMLMTC